MTAALTKITYVEDEPDIREIAKIALETVGGFKVDLCASGQEALDRSPTFKPCLILLDVMMPAMDGIETLKRLRKIPSLNATPIVFMTAKAQPNEIQQYLSCGAAAVIAKPFDPMALADQVRAIWQSQDSKPSHHCSD